jgi:hypothetical protein
MTTGPTSAAASTGWSGVTNTYIDSTVAIRSTTSVVGLVIPTDRLLYGSRMLESPNNYAAEREAILSHFWSL